ncbi:Porin family protein [Candidatus Hepatincolaceae symbiont of Richtersius coronifer]
MKIKVIFTMLLIAALSTNLKAKERRYVTGGLGGELTSDRKFNLNTQLLAGGVNLPGSTSITPTLNSKGTAIVPALAYGYEFGNFSTEINYSYAKNEFKYTNDDSTTTNKVNTHNIMLKGYYKFLPKEKINPYVGAGVGLVMGEDELKAAVASGTQAGSTIDFGSKSLANFGAMLIAGAQYNLSNKFALAVEYNFGYLDASTKYDLITPVSSGVDLMVNAKLKSYLSHTLGVKVKYYI